MEGETQKEKLHKSKRYIIKCKTLIHPEKLKKLQEEFMKQLNENGVIVVNDMFEIVEIQEGADLEWKQ